MAPEQTEQDEGGGLKKKVATGVAVGIATTAAAGVAKKLLDSNGDDDQGSQDAQSRSRGSQSGRGTSTSGQQSRGSSTSQRSTQSRSQSSRRRASGSARSKAKSSATSASRSTNPTKEQLYRQATRLRIEGRSKMNKAQLQRAVARRK